MKRIPSSFELGPHTITVVKVTEQEMGALFPEYAKNPPYGMTVYGAFTIYVQKVTRKFPAKLQKHTFWHEYFHMLLHCASRDRLAADEVLVDTLGGLQLQAFQTMK